MDEEQILSIKGYPFNAQEDTGVLYHWNFNSILRRDHQKKFLWASRLWVGRRKERTLGYVPKNDEKENLVHKGLRPLLRINFFRGSSHNLALVSVYGSLKKWYGNCSEVLPYISELRREIACIFSSYNNTKKKNLHHLLWKKKKLAMT